MGDAHRENSGIYRLREFPKDLIGVICLVLLTNAAVFVPAVRATPVRLVLGYLFLLFLPGYAIVAALFPRHGGRETADPYRTSWLTARGIDGVERFVLSAGTSLAVVPLVAFVLSATGYGVRLGPIVVATSALTIVATLVGAVHRLSFPPAERFSLPVGVWARSWLATTRGLFGSTSRYDRALNVLLVVSLLLAVSGAVYAVTVPQPDSGYTEFYLLNRTTEGDLTADEFPTEFQRSEPQELVVGIGNKEQQSTTYTVVIELQRLSAPNSDGGDATVVEETELQRFEMQVGQNETELREHTVEPTLLGTDLRLVYLLYQGDPPRNPSVDNAYRDVHLLINVSTS